MKLSFPILEHWLQDYRPLATIESGECDLEGVRLFSNTAKPHSGFLYVGRNRDFFDSSTSNEVLLVHGKEVMSLTTYDLEDVFNKVVEAFEFYADWERRLMQAAGSAKPQQEIIDCCAGVIDPLFFIDQHLNVPAFSREYGMGSVNENWDDFWQHGTFSLHRFNEMKNGVTMQMLNSTWHCALFDEPSADHYIHGIMMSQVGRDQSLIGQLIYISDAPFQTWQIQLAGTVDKVLNLVELPSPAEKNDSAAQFLLKEILTAGQDSPLDCERLRSIQDWDEAAELGILCFRPKHPSSGEALPLTADQIMPFLPESVTAVIGEDIVCCLPGTAVPDLEGCCSELALSCGLVCTASYFFEGTSRLRHQYRQAKESLPHCIARQRDFLPFGSCALEVLTGHVDDREFYRLGIHPALARIKEYDRSHRTRFYDTLRTYLRNERNRTETAKAMFVHKNTLVYRLQKLEGLFGLDLDNGDEREYLLLSFRMDSNAE